MPFDVFLFSVLSLVELLCDIMSLSGTKSQNGTLSKPRPLRTFDFGKRAIKVL